MPEQMNADPLLQVLEGNQVLDQFDVAVLGIEAAQFELAGRLLVDRLLPDGAAGRIERPLPPGFVGYFDCGHSSFALTASIVLRF